MIRDFVDRFAYRLQVWRRDRRDEYFTGMKSFWRRLVLVVLIFGLGLGVGVSIGIYYGRAAALVVEPEQLKVESSTGDTLDDGYTLFTWARSRRLCFAIVPRIKRGEFARNWFAKCAGECGGITGLEKKLATFPEGTSIEWTDWPNDWNGKKFAFPQDEVTDPIRNFAKAKHLKLTFCCGWVD